jgi:translation initiation factor IF-3
MRRAPFSLAGVRIIGRRQSKPKPRVETHRVGRRIRVKEVRVIDEKGEQLGIMPTQEAMSRAEELGLQLVEVNPKTVPPVCKIMDYGKFKYETAKRDREAKKHQKTTELKEVKFRPKTHDHDFDFKTRHIRRFIEEGDKVKLVVQFRGREITHPETGRAILERIIRELADVTTILQMAQMEGNRMNMVLAPKPKSQMGKPAGPKPAVETRPPAPRPAVPAAPAAPPPPATGTADADYDDDDYDDMEDDTTGIDPV